MSDTKITSRRNVDAGVLRVNGVQDHTIAEVIVVHGRQVRLAVGYESSDGGAKPVSIGGTISVGQARVLLDALRVALDETA